ncbi:MAG TPA: ATP-binding protein, partial [Tepidisphaeraceae bacterium]|nr:ATP-binding protein [Tepidisphaeraceae bacterium]
PTRLHELLRHTLEVCASDIHARRIRIDQQFDATTDLVIADSARLGQVFWNLLKNAVKFSESGGTIVVRTSGIAGDGRAAPPGVRAEIIDNGVGIPANVLPRVFDAFEQGDVRTTRQFGGLGLGLAISKAVVDMHGGRIRATSAGPGMGATFTVELNAASGALADKDARQSSPQDSRPVARARILLVEDHADTARILARLLHHAGYEAHAVHNIAAALDAAAKQPFDLLISDIGLPDGNGFDLMAQIKSRHGISGIALTGYGMEDDMRRGREAGFVDHVVKPVSIPQLEQVIQRVLQDEQRVR